MGKSSKSADIWPLTVMMCRPLQLLQLMLLLFLLPEAGARAPTKTLPSKCREKCGDVAIPYPFGVGDGCYLEGFDITCNYTYNPPRPFISTGNIEIINISLLTGELRVYKHIAYACYNNTAQLNFSSAPIDLTGNPAAYRLSSTRNKFTAVGCDTLAYILNLNGYTSGCVSICNTPKDTQPGPCNGMGCCQTSIPQDLLYYEVSFDKKFNNNYITNFNPCSYAFLAENDWFEFDASALSAEFYSRHNRRGPMVLDWAIRNETCVEAARNLPSYACVSKNSLCYNSSNGPGYLCNCSIGYEGNPYVSDGCKDINECDNPEAYSCYGACTNVPGSYMCMCLRGTKGDPTSKNGCHPIPNVKETVIITGVFVLGGTLVLLATGVLLMKKLKGRNIRKRRDKFFRENRGLLLQQLVSSDETLIEGMRIITIEELEKATNNFDSTRVVGGGGHGTVYKGILSDQRVVAIKKSKISDRREIDQFINEVVLLSQINHRNIVKLFGCCLESEVPLLVYEFISGGTLIDHLRVGNYISLDDRLRIAAEVAGALAYLHTSASISIFHRDVKSSNILLDEHHTAKVSDFGASRSVPINQSYIATDVEGTYGYLDPEYFQTGLLTNKSDVYSFGVILVELLTRKPSVSLERPVQEKNLSMHFIYALKENRLFHILDTQILDEGSKQEFEAVARLADVCLRICGKERPTMKEVEQNLDYIRRFRKRKYGSQALLHNLKQVQGDSSSGTSSTSTTEEYSIVKEITLPLIGSGSFVAV